MAAPTLLTVPCLAKGLRMQSASAAFEAHHASPRCPTPLGVDFGGFTWAHHRAKHRMTCRAGTQGALSRLFILNDFFVGLAAWSPGPTPALLGKLRLNVVRDNPPTRHCT